MTLSSRERYLMIIVLAAIAIYALDRFAVSPFLAQRLVVATQSASLQSELDRAEQLLTNHPRMEARWRQFTQRGLHSDSQRAESELLAALSNWSSRAGLALPSVKPQRTIQNDELRELVVLVNGSGSMQAVARFVYELESSDIPVRIVTLTVSTRTEGEDQLTVQMRISTLYQRVTQTPIETAAVAPSAGDSSS